MIGYCHEIQRASDLHLVAGGVVDGLPDSKFVGILGSGLGVAEDVSVKRPAGVNMSFAKIGVAVGVAVYFRG